MNSAMAMVVSAGVAVGVAVTLGGCGERGSEHPKSTAPAVQTEQPAAKTEHPAAEAGKAEQPAAEHPKGEHPSSEHPK